MKSAADYKSYAALCRTNADGAVSGDERAELLETAESWRVLASLREGIAGRRQKMMVKDLPVSKQR